MWVFMSALLYMQITAYSLKGHLEYNGSLVFYCCPSAESTAMDRVVTAMCRSLRCQCLCVWCTNWDSKVHASSCATAEDIVLGLSACFHWNPLHTFWNDAQRFSSPSGFNVKNVPFVSSVRRRAEEGSWWHGHHNGGVCWRSPTRTSGRWRKRSAKTTQWGGGGVFVSADSRSLSSFLSEDL